jgi:hypothetical protein
MTQIHYADLVTGVIIGMNQQKISHNTQRPELYSVLLRCMHFGLHAYRLHGIWYAASACKTEVQANNIFSGCFVWCKHEVNFWWSKKLEMERENGENRHFRVKSRVQLLRARASLI